MAEQGCFGRIEGGIESHIGAIWRSYMEGRD